MICFFHTWTKRRVEEFNRLDGFMYVYEEKVCLNCGKHKKKLIDKIFLGV